MVDSRWTWICGQCGGHYTPACDCCPMCKTKRPAFVETASREPSEMEKQSLEWWELERLYPEWAERNKKPVQDVRELFERALGSADLAYDYTNLTHGESSDDYYDDRAQDMFEIFRAGYNAALTASEAEQTL